MMRKENKHSLTALYHFCDVLQPLSHIGICVPPHPFIPLPSRNRPSTMFLNYHINLLHQHNCLTQSRHNSLVMLDILKRQSSPFAILQPLMAHLVTPNMKIPYLRWHPLKILLLMDVSESVFFAVSLHEYVYPQGADCLALLYQANSCSVNARLTEIIGLNFSYIASLFTEELICEILSGI